MVQRPEPGATRGQVAQAVLLVHWRLEQVGGSNTFVFVRFSKLEELRAEFLKAAGSGSGSFQ
eukprot:2201185-Alexandrium_andersonii.AAC.1